ncbi:S8 family serine peptidase [Streptomyces goshikiensis]|uniref:S8 family peptidase n=1 Tax=Streptomyces goshikiensis TaxID=1942 RepID=UPI0036551BC3
MRRAWVAAGVAAVLGLAACAPKEPGEPTGPGGPGAPGTSAPPSASARPSPSGAPSPAPSGKPAPGPSPTGSAGSGTAPEPVVRTGVPWHLDRLDQRTGPPDGRFSARADGSGVHVYVIDTGLDVAHAEFGGRATLGADFVGKADSSDCLDGLGLGHGTFVAGIIAGTTYGVAPRADLVRVQGIACEEGSGSAGHREAAGAPDAGAPDAGPEAAIVKSVDWVTAHAHRPAVVNMSLNLKNRSADVDAAVRRLIDSGIPVVVAAGNFSDDACGHSPAGVGGAIVVAASTRADRHWKDSEGFGSGYGTCVDLYAPGERITSLLAGGGTVTDEAGATSWATPHVTGVVALYLSAHPAATPAQVRTWLLGRAVPGALTGVPAGTPNRLLNTGGL